MNQNDVDMDIADESPPPTTITTMSSDQTIKHLLSRHDVSSSLDKRPTAKIRRSRAGMPCVPQLRQNS